MRDSGSGSEECCGAEKEVTRVGEGGGEGRRQCP